MKRHEPAVITGKILRKSLGEILVELKAITVEQLEDALKILLLSEGRVPLWDKE